MHPRIWSTTIASRSACTACTAAPVEPVPLRRRALARKAQRRLQHAPVRRNSRLAPPQATHRVAVQLRRQCRRARWVRRRQFLEVLLPVQALHKLFCVGLARRKARVRDSQSLMVF
mmetsp:Transcript_99725/g.277736  ORF Transcript_99725/g.277736 Transcript_99725/m.277736 type:complete len:116 (+) Transcript_99725:1677-2024(+)